MMFIKPILVLSLAAVALAAPSTQPREMLGTFYSSPLPLDQTPKLNVGLRAVRHIDHRGLTEEIQSLTGTKSPSDSKYRSSLMFDIDVTNLYTLQCAGR